MCQTCWVYLSATLLRGALSEKSKLFSYVYDISGILAETVCDDTNVSVFDFLPPH